MQIAIVVMHYRASTDISNFSIAKSLVAHAADAAHFVVLNLAVKTGVTVAAAWHLGKTGGEA